MQIPMCAIYSIYRCIQNFIHILPYFVVFQWLYVYIYTCISDQLKNKIYYHDICYYPLCGLPLQLLATYHLRLCPLSLTLSTGNSRFSRFSRFSRLSRPVGRFFTAVKTGICLTKRYGIYLFIYLLIYIYYIYIHKEIYIYIILKAST